MSIFCIDLSHFQVEQMHGQQLKMLICKRNNCELFIKSNDGNKKLDNPKIVIEIYKTV